MNLIVTRDYDEMSEEASLIFKKRIEENPNIVLGLATGSTPKGLYKNLIRYHKEEGLDFSKVVTFNLDEYIGLSEEDKTSYRYFMNNILFNHININRKNIYIPDGKAKDVNKHCQDYDRKIDEIGGIDLLLLGIGEDGHIAFNEPGEHLHIATNVTQLSNSTIEVNSRFFENKEDVPRQAITMGMGHIMKSKEIILIANGEKKARAIERLIKDKKVTTELPVSFLLIHPRVTIIVDEKAYERCR